MAKLVVGVVTLVALAILVVLNINYKSTINLFGAQLENVSVIVIAIAGFVLGIVYSGVLYFVNLLNNRQKAKQKKTQQGLKDKEAQLAEREASVAAHADHERDRAGTSAETAPEETPKPSTDTARASTRPTGTRRSRRRK